MDTGIRLELISLLPRLRRFGVSLTRSQDKADDLVQAACERALRSEVQWQPGTRLDSWMFRIMRNLWIDEIRRTRTQGPQEHLDEMFDLAGDDGVKASEFRSEASAVELAIQRLPEEFRSVLVLVCIEELSYREAAEVLGVPIGTVMSRLARARRNIASDLGLEPGLRSFDAGE
jgi:RNA polymerase sigma-70 factor (ECF subfamily)